VFESIVRNVKKNDDGLKVTTVSSQDFKERLV